MVIGSQAVPTDSQCGFGPKLQQNLLSILVCNLTYLFASTKEIDLSLVDLETTILWVS